MSKPSLRVVLCRPKQAPYNALIEPEIKSTIDFIGGYISVSLLKNKLLLYQHEHPTDDPFNRMFRTRPIYGSFLISKFGHGNRVSLSSDEIKALLKELVLNDNSAN